MRKDLVALGGDSAPAESVLLEDEKRIGGHFYVHHIVQHRDCRQLGELLVLGEELGESERLLY